MPIVSGKRSVVTDNKKPKPTVPEISTPPLVTIPTDTRYEPASSLLISIEGSPWTVDYYSQVVTDSTLLGGQSLGTDPVIQQYRRLVQFQLRVTDALKTTQDTDTNEMVVTGGANVYPCLVPNVGDMLVADIGDGRSGILRVNRVERKSVFKDAVHTIEYSLVDYTTPERAKDLESKVIQRLYFIRDYLEYGQNPLLEAEEYHTLDQLGEVYYQIADRWFKEFHSNEYRTLCVPLQREITYDPYHTRAVKRMFSARDTNWYNRVTSLTSERNAHLISMTVWDAILERDPTLLSVAAQRYRTVTAEWTGGHPGLQDLRWQGPSRFVYASDAALASDQYVLGSTEISNGRILDVPVPGKVGFTTQFEGAESSPGIYSNRPTVEIPSETRDAELIPLFPRVGLDDYYVFSSAFYSGDRPTMTRLELLVYQWLNKEEIDSGSVARLAASVYKLPQLERFYHGPIVLFLIRVVLRTLS